MNAPNNLFPLAIPLGRFLGTRVRVSAFMLIAVLAVVWRVQEFTTSLLFSIVLFLSVCLHEIVHLSLSFRMNLRCSERILWPFGGLFGETPRRPDAVVSLAGPAVNLAVALVVASQLDIHTDIPELLNPATCWQAVQSDSTVTLLLRIVFLVNLLIAIPNLIPVRPMAGGYVLKSILLRRFSEIESRDMLLRSGLVLSIFGLMAGFVFDLSGVTALAAFLLLQHVQEAVQWFQPPASDAAFNAYDFSDHSGDPGYGEPDTAELSQNEDFSDGMADRWKDRRESESHLRERELELREHDELDRVLEKLHTKGRDALTAAEIHLLNRVSARLRQKNHQ